MSLLIVPLLYPDFGGVTEFFTPHFRITFGLPTTRNVAGPLNTSAFNGTDLQTLLETAAVTAQFLSATA
jgi:hypothetical protein